MGGLPWAQLGLRTTRAFAGQAFSKYPPCMHPDCSDGSSDSGAVGASEDGGVSGESGAGVAMPDRGVGSETSSPASEAPTPASQRPTTSSGSSGLESESSLGSLGAEAGQELGQRRAGRPDSSLATSSAGVGPEDPAAQMLVVSGRRRRAQVDYRALHAAMFGTVRGNGTR